MKTQSGALGSGSDEIADLFYEPLFIKGCKFLAVPEAGLPVYSPLSSELAYLSLSRLSLALLGKHQNSHMPVMPSKLLSAPR